LRARCRFYIDNPHPLAVFVQQRCLERGISLTEACLEMGISTGTISNIARRRHEPDLATLVAIADWADTPLTRVLELAGYLKRPPQTDRLYSEVMELIVTMDDAELEAVRDYAEYLRWRRRKRRRRST